MITDKKYAKLIMVTGINNNKYYEMLYEGGSNFTINYGRIESTKTTLQKPHSQWDSIYKEKVKKGYKDMTHTISVTVEDKVVEPEKDLDIIQEIKVNQFLTLMKQYTDGLVAKTYTVKAKDVTKAQVDEAQGYINELLKIDKKDEVSINSKLLELYMVIPRYMSKVQLFLLPNIDLDKTLQQEQDNLDAMASQVSMVKTSVDIKEDNKVEIKKSKTLLDVLGIKMKEIKGHSDLDYLIKQLTPGKIHSIFEIEKEEHGLVYNKWMGKQKDKTVRFLLHGTKCTSVIPIIEQGLKIRPQGNYQFSGKVYGDGNYFSETCSKSLGYTGYDKDQVLLVYQVHVGNPFVYNGWYNGNSFTLSYNELQKRDFDSTFVKAGGGLLNTEIIVYKEEQCSIKYIIWLKR
jgi:poly [ADP-ribose] polymerase